MFTVQQRPTLGWICVSVMCGSLLSIIVYIIVYYWTQSVLYKRQLVLIKEKLRKERWDASNRRRQIYKVFKLEKTRKQRNNT